MRLLAVCFLGLAWAVSLPPPVVEVPYEEGGENETDTSTLPTSAASSTSIASTTIIPTIGNPSILGCTWPADFTRRYEFCAKKSGIEFEEGHVASHDVKYGLLDPAILQELMAECAKGNLSSCVKPVKEDALTAFESRWNSVGDANTEFQKCLQENTEAMNRLCGADSEVGKVVSGAAGLQLNLIGALERVHKLPDANLSKPCFHKMIETVHITAAMYLQSEHYMDNSVLCWNVVNKVCGEECAAFAAQLNCLLSQCPEIPLRIFQEFGIWQWYYLNAPMAGRKCGLEGKKCQTIEIRKRIEGEGSGGGAESLFDMDHIKAKFDEMSKSLESTFNLPFSVLLAIAVSAFVAFVASALMLCLWKYGFCGGKKRKLRYSRLDEGEESKSLTSIPEQLLD